MHIEITLTGTRPLLVHSERLANPFDPLTRQMKSIGTKRKRTPDDLEAIMRIEFEGGLYLDSAGSPIIPSWNVKRCFQDSGKINKLGMHVGRAFDPRTDFAVLDYDGPRTVQGLWDAGLRFRDVRSVKIGTSKVNRCRPRFDEWSLSFDADLDTSILGIEEFAEVAARAGAMIGLGDFRQRFGRFTVAITELAA